MNTSQSRVYLIFIFIVVFLLVFVIFVGYRIGSNRSLPRLQTSDFDSALRGSILTADGFSVVNSQKLYKATVNTRNIDPNKKELFIRLYSLYSDTDPKLVEKALKGRQGAVTLSRKIDAKGAAYLKELARKLYRQKVFIPYQDPKTGVITTQGLDITETGENRSYIAGDALTPLIGYVRKVDRGDITKVEGVKGIEAVYDEDLGWAKDEKIVGPRDLSNTIILSRESKTTRRQDGNNVVLNVSMRLQTQLEKLADTRAQFLSAKEIVIGVMDSKSGRVIALVSSARYNPNSISKKDYEHMNSTASEYAYEVGSVMKPIIFSLLLADNKVNPIEMVNVHGGKYTLKGGRVISDTHKANFLSAEDIIIQSSNIGMVKIIERMDNTRLHERIKDFGFAQKSGIDLSHEQVGRIPSARDFKNATYKATVSYGYGLQATFMQLLSAYNAINNDGVMVRPKLLANIERDGKKYYPAKKETPKNVLDTESARKMKQILTKVIESPKGTGRAARIPGLNLAGKTGTAHIAMTGGYSDKRYNASFFGFASDASGNNYTIGVLVREPMKPYPYYFASWSALPVFKATVETMVEDGFLSPSEAFNATKIESGINEALD